MIRATITIDATNQVPGRIATKVATILMGKHKADYTPNIDMGDCVLVENCAQMKFSNKKLTTKKYYRHSNYPGGLTTTFAKDLPATEIIERAVYSMLPKNRLKAKRLKRLTLR